MYLPDEVKNFDRAQKKYGISIRLRCLYRIYLNEQGPAD